MSIRLPGINHLIFAEHRKIESFLKVLEQFKKSEVQIVSRNDGFENIKKELKKGLQTIDEGSAIFLTLEAFEN